jgi:modulator of FtsH protease
MGLYDRDYARSSQTDNGLERINYQTREEEQPHVITDINAFVKTTYMYFAASLMAGTAGAYAGMQAAATIKSFYWPLVILEIALIFGLNFVRNKPGINSIVLFAFTFISGLTLTPLLSTILHMPGGAGIVTNAFLMTSVAFGALTMFAMNTKKDFTMMGKMLFIALIIMIVGGVVNIFLGSPILQLILAGAGALLFSFFILYDTQNIIQGAYDSPVSAAASLYLDFLNLFVSLLQILGIFGGREE